MGINILNKILDFGLEKGYFELFSIKKLDKSCCKKTEVIDFDETKRIICKKNQWDEIKSCDALKFRFEEEKRIDFIEMKSIKNLSRNPELKKEGRLQKQITKFDFKGKIRDSIIILSSITQERGVLTAEERKEFYEIKKQPIFLTDINFDTNSTNYIALSLDFMGSFSTHLEKLLIEEVNLIEADSLNNLQQPILMDCEEFKKYYN